MFQHPHSALCFCLTVPYKGIHGPGGPLFSGEGAFNPTPANFYPGIKKTYVPLNPQTV